MVSTVKRSSTRVRLRPRSRPATTRSARTAPATSTTTTPVCPPTTTSGTPPRLNVTPEVVRVLDDPRDHQGQAGGGRRLDRQMNALVGMDPPEDHRVLAGVRAEGEVRQADAVVDGCHVVEGRVSIRITDRHVEGVAIVLPVDGQDGW